MTRQSATTSDISPPSPRTTVARRAVTSGTQSDSRPTQPSESGGKNSRACSTVAHPSRATVPVSHSSSSMSPAPNAPSGEIIVQVFGRTDVGRTREHNEDAFVVADMTTDNATLQPEVRSHVTGVRGTLFMVADGMGGAAAGEIASDMAVKIVLEELRTDWAAAPVS